MKTTTRLRVALALSSFGFAVGFPIVVHISVVGWGCTACAALVPLSLAAWQWGRRKGLLAALMGIGFLYATVIPHLLMHYGAFSAYWLQVLLIPPAVFLFVAAVVGHLSESLHDLGKSRDAVATAEQSLVQNEEHFRDLFTNAPFGYFRSTVDGLLVAANPSFARIFGFVTAEEAMTAVNAVGIEKSLYETPGQRAAIVSETIQMNKWQQKVVRVRKSNGEAISVNQFMRVRPLPAKEVLLEGFIEDVTERISAEERALRSSQHLQALLDAIPDTVFELDQEGRVLSWRSRGQHHPSFDDPQGLGRTIWEAMPADAAKAISETLSAARSSSSQASNTYCLEMNDKPVWIELYIWAIGDGDNSSSRYVAVARDITERKNLERQLVQSQKMEAIGRLAGGVAHDFNNIMMIILGYCASIESHPQDHKTLLAELRVVTDSANRAAALTKQLLAFSRKQQLQTKVLDASALLLRMQPMLARTLGEDIELTVNGAADTTIKADEGQLQQVIMNLAVNAREAMPGGGRLALSVENVTVREDCSQRPVGLKSGHYALVTVSDTGSGMSQEALSHLFEPFYTTKKEGTGLGLSIVYGIVKQSQGFIYAQSTEDRGTTFRIYLPKSMEKLSREAAPACTTQRVRGSETLLLVEDEPEVRKLLRLNLERNGYRILEASDGAQALRVGNQHKGQIDLLLTDVVMPGIGGSEVADAFRSDNPDVPVIFMTGYSDRQDLGQDDSHAVSLLSKPFSMSDMLAKVESSLESSRRS